MSLIIKRALHAKELPPNPTEGEVFHGPKDCYIVATRSIDVMLGPKLIGHIATITPRPQGYYVSNCVIAREVAVGTSIDIQVSDVYYTSAIWTSDGYWAGTGTPVKTTILKVETIVEYVSDYQKVGSAYCYRELRVKERKGTK